MDKSLFHAHPIFVIYLVAYRDFESGAESGIGRSIRTGEESRMTRYTVSPVKKVNFEDDQSDGKSSGIIEIKPSRKERKKEKRRREKALGKKL